MSAGASGTGPVVALGAVGDPSVDLHFDQRVGLGLSVGIHLLVISSFLLWGHGNSSDEAPVIAPERLMTARLVAKGKPRPKKLLPRIMGRKPSKKKAKSLGKVARDTKKKATKKAEKEPEVEETPQDRSAADILKDLMKTRVDPRADKQPERYGREDGDDMGVASEGRTTRIYIDNVNRKLTGTTQYTGIEETELATVYLEIEAAGKIVSYRFDKRSGNSRFDAQVERAVRIFSTGGPRALDPPPDALLKSGVYKMRMTWSPKKKR